MECFGHEGGPAVGTCRACGKGVCRACAADLGRGIACAGRCEEPARALIAALDQSVRMQGLSGGMLTATRTLWTALSWISLGIGAFVSIWALGLPEFQEIALLGLPFFAIGVVTLHLSRRARAAGTASNST
jgi:hypothetical protein